MKKLLFLLMLSCVALPSDKTEEVATKAAGYLPEYVTQYLGPIGQVCTVISAVKTIYNVQQYVCYPSEEDQLKDRVRIAELAAREAVAKKTLMEEEAAQELRTCLNTNTPCRDLNEYGTPKMCSSLVRRYAFLNEPETERIIAKFKKYNV